MRRLSRNIALFALPFLGLLVYILAAQYDKEYAYNVIQKDCRSGNWIHQRLFENDRPIDVAFLGTSKTMCNVQDIILEEKVQRKYGHDLSIANMGVCRTGINLHYLIARDLFSTHPPKYIIFEASHKMQGNSHFHFPYLAESADFLFPPLILNGDYLVDLETGIWNRWMFQKNNLLGIQYEYDEILKEPDHSFMVVPNGPVPDSALMARIKKKNLKVQKAPPENFPGSWLEFLDLNVSKSYIGKLKALADAHNCKFITLYLPNYGHPADQPRDYAYYQELGEVWIPPDSVFSNPNLYFDPAHLNQNGAGMLTDWLSEQLDGLLK